MKRSFYHNFVCSKNARLPSLAIVFLAACADTHRLAPFDVSEQGSNLTACANANAYEHEKNQLFSKFETTARVLRRLSDEKAEAANYQIPTPFYFNCCGLFLFGAAMGLTNWLDQQFPDAVDINEKASVLEHLTSLLNQHFYWTFQRYQTADTLPLPIFISAVTPQFIYVDAHKQLVRGSVSYESRQDIIDNKFSPTSLPESKLKANTDIIDPTHPMFDANALFEYINKQLAVYTDDSSTNPDPAESFCGPSPFLANRHSQRAR